MLFSWLLPKTLSWSLCLLVSPAAIDCVVGSWGPWSSCTSPCGVGSTERSRQVSIPPRNGGTPCPDLKQRRGCFGNNAVCSSAKGDTLLLMPLHTCIYACRSPTLNYVSYLFGVSVFSVVPPVNSFTEKHICSEALSPAELCQKPRLRSLLLHLFPSNKTPEHR